MRGGAVAITVLAGLALLGGCCSHLPATRSRGEQKATILTVMSLVDGRDADFEIQSLDEFAARRRNLKVRYIPAFESDDERLAMYKQLFREQSPQPDLCEIDVIWPGMIAEDLVDLFPYFRNELQAFPAELLQSYTVGGKLIAIPLFLDSGLLYYRSDLLRKYGFDQPPESWDELERMARIIQEGERKFRDPHFWGYVWQGGATEALTCNALEWQASYGGGHIIEPDGTISVCNQNSVRALQRAVSWIGKISPPGVTTYTEDDSLNFFRAGHAAFMRNWTSTYGNLRDPACGICKHAEVALLPAGPAGRSRTLGGIALAVSKYSEHRDEAISALQYLVSEMAQIRRVKEGGSAPTRLALQLRPDLMQQTAFHGLRMVGHILTGLTARPSVVAGNVYDQVSKAYFSAVHSALTKQVAPAAALGNLQVELARITRGQSRN